MIQPFNGLGVRIVGRFFLWVFGVFVVGGFFGCRLKFCRIRRQTCSLRRPRGSFRIRARFPDMQTFGTVVVNGLTVEVQGGF